LQLENSDESFDVLVARGDAARDIGLWNKAAKYYRQALLLRSSADGVLIQLGHALKESGDLDGAEEVYLQARRLQPEDAELSLQLGHFYSIKGDTAAAIANYRQSIAAGLEDRHALHYLAEAGADFEIPPIAEGATVPVVYLDLSDLLSYFREKRSPTGIQRVQIELFKASLSWNGPVPVRACAFVDAQRFWVDLDPVAFRKLCELAATPGSSLDREWRETVDAFHRRMELRKPCEMPAGAALINLGPWWEIDYMLMLRDAKSRFGLRYVPFIHDLIPIIAPEHLPPGGAAVFSYWLNGALMHSDAIITNSEFTRADVIEVAKRVRPIEEMPVVVRFDARLNSPAAIGTTERRHSLARFGLRQGNFVLFVSTLEARKNHLLVFQAWARLLSEHGAGDVPVLVCVGRRGWQFDHAEAFLNNHPALEQKVVLLSGISDVELHTLYGACLFTVYSTFYEGWGLPVTESLCCGKVCLAPHHSSLPEAGGKFAEYYERDSPKSLADNAERLIYDHEFRASRERLIAEEYRPRSWEDVLSGMIHDLLPHFQAPPSTQPTVAPVTFGTIYDIGQPMVVNGPSRNSAVAEMLRADRGWHGVEAWGVFSREATAALAFQLPSFDARQGEDILIYLHVRAPEEAVGLSVYFGTATLIRVALSARERRVLQLRLPAHGVAQLANAGRPATLRLEVDHMVDLRQHGPSDSRNVGIGVEFFAICLEDDVAARLSVLERCCLHVQRARQVA
jgi:glycosyltransferase involved in cell wall biosynthesis